MIDGVACIGHNFISACTVRSTSSIPVLAAFTSGIALGWFDGLQGAGGDVHGALAEMGSHSHGVKGSGGGQE